LTGYIRKYYADIADRYLCDDGAVADPDFFTNKTDVGYRGNRSKMRLTHPVVPLVPVSLAWVGTGSDVVYALPWLKGPPARQ
jgi:hypothetical protein